MTIKKPSATSNHPYRNHENPVKPKIDPCRRLKFTLNMLRPDTIRPETKLAVIKDLVDLFFFNCRSFDG